MSIKSPRPHPPDDLRRWRRRLQRLDPSEPGYTRQRSEILHNIELAKAQVGKPRSGLNTGTGARKSTSTSRPARRKSATKRKTQAKATASTPSSSDKKGNSLTRLLDPKNLKESLKQVGNLRSSVKTWLGYLQQADQLLDTFYMTSNSLKESGVLEKLVKSRGKNLNTEDFTNILMALMNTPVGAQLFNSKSDDDSSESASGDTSAAT